MNILFHGGCQLWAIGEFIRMSPAAETISVNTIQRHRLRLGEETRENEKKAVEAADIIFAHKVKGELPWPGDVQPKAGVEIVPMSVFYNSGFFLSNTEDWSEIINLARSGTIDSAVRHAVNEADLGYSERFKNNFDRMLEKERDEEIPQNLQISSLVANYREQRQLLTNNHPSSIIFYSWANLVLKRIGKPCLDDGFYKRCMNEENIANLPCFDGVCTAAKRHLGLSWGGEERDNEVASHHVRNILEAALG